MKVTFWGVRGSLPTPAQAADDLWKLEEIVKLAARAGVDERGAGEFLRGLPPALLQPVGGNTPCVEVRSGDDMIILDAGSGLRPLGVELNKGAAFSESDLYLAIEAGHNLDEYTRREDGRDGLQLHLLLSHTHWDHIQGFPFFTPAYNPATAITIYGRSADDLARAFSDQQTPLNFPIPLSGMGAEITFQSFPEGGLTLGDMRISALEIPHPGGSLAYRISAGGRTVVYATDYEFSSIDSPEAGEAVDFIKNADLLISDTQYTHLEGAAKGGWGHSTAFGAIDLAMRAGVKALYMFHYDPGHTDAKLWEILDKSRAYHKMMSGGADMAVELATEGLAVEL